MVMLLSKHVAFIRNVFINKFPYHHHPPPPPLISPTAGAANEGVLANFFNSLLSKKTGAPGSPGAGAVGAGVQGSAKKTGTTSNSSAFTSDLSEKQKLPII